MSENPQNSENPQDPEHAQDPEKPQDREKPQAPENPQDRVTPQVREPSENPDASGRTGGDEPEAVKAPAPAVDSEAHEASVAAEAPAAAAPSGRRRLASALWPPRVTRAQLVVALLLFVLGLGLAIQVSSTSENSALRGARQEDLVRILDELDDRTQRLEDEKARLEKQRSELESSSDQAEEARKQTQEKERQLGILAGTVAAEGPGITLTVGDPTGAVESDMLLDAIQELRAAGAEAIQVNGVRVVADSYFTGSGDDMRIDGTKVAAPYVFKVIGKPEDLEPALNIPGGVVQTLEKEQATATVERSAKIVVDALRPAKRPDYAQSSSQ
ncbi:membrane protein [Streptomyces tanashiensis]|nr:membrane protein [Streptomyces tanashiensis]